MNVPHATQTSTQTWNNNGAVPVVHNIQTFNKYEKFKYVTQVYIITECVCY